jgi:hypothetical protein
MSYRTRVMRGEVRQQGCRLLTADGCPPGVLWPQCHGDTEGGLYICHRSCWQLDTVWPHLCVCPREEGQRLVHYLPRAPRMG